MGRLDWVMFYVGLLSEDTAESRDARRGVRPEKRYVVQR
jgi:hypothetical protein